MKLANKVALVTGAARGNGLGIALTMAREGADIALVDLSLAKVTEAAQQITALGRRCVPIEADAGDEASIRRMLGETIEKLGKLDIIVNNAGVFPFKPIEQFTLAEFQKVLQVNVTGPWLIVKHALPELKKNRGAVVNITSCSGHFGGASVGGSAYDTSKAALRQMTTSLAVELGPYGIRLNAIAPGVIITEGMGGQAFAESQGGKNEIARTPLRRLGLPADVGNVAAFLASDEAAFVTGITVVLDGGAMAGW
ncbi:MAG TPA: SDR family oxidoreductase [Planctomycetota bacterium]|nr:SDR family oxidoreductase [Planctomycetota bacterium]